MKLTLPLFLIVLALSVFVYPLWGATRIAAGFGNAVQILALVVGAINLRRVTNSFSSSDAPRSAWVGLQIGITIWVLAQILELRDEFILHDVQYGGVTDVVWLLGYLPLFYGVIRLIGNYRSTGLPLGSAASYLLQCGALLVLYGVLFQQSIWPQITAPERSLAMKALDLGYPTMDFLLFAAGSILLRFSLILRGGSLGRVWLLLCVGFLMMGIADILLSNLPNLQTPAYRYLDVLYISSYFFIALAARNQYSIARPAQH